MQCAWTSCQEVAAKEDLDKRQEWAVLMEEREDNLLGLYWTKEEGGYRANFTETNLPDVEGQCDEQDR